MIIALLSAAVSAASLDPLLAEMQRVEARRNTAIKAGNFEALRKLYAPAFHGIAAGGARVDRDTLLGVFKRNAGGDFIADSTILSARRINGLVFAEGRLKLTTKDRTQIISDSYYLHIYRRRAGRWEMIEGASTPIAQAGH